MSRSKEYLLKLAAIVVMGGLGFTAGAADPARSFRFNIENQSLAQALRSFGHVAGQEIVFTDDLVKDIKAVSLQGEYTAEAALSRLLTGTGLAAKRVKSGAITIVKASAQELSQATVADQMRLAALDSAGANDSAGSAESAAESARDSSGQVVVQGEREKRKPFTDANVDIPRTIDDVQPYYIFDGKIIGQSGAANVEDFLKQRLTMNTTAQTEAETSALASLGNISTINLRGLGSDKTLILINGRRVAGVNIGTSDYQPDLNGIPMNSVERIEVLPSSASGIYGGSAIGGVVNVILKRDYAGGEVRAVFDDTWSGDSPRRNVSLSYGVSVEGGRTHLNFSTAWSEREPMQLRDRVDIYVDNLTRIQSRSATFIYSNTNPWLGSLPNIAPSSSAVSTLRLKSGNIPLNSRNTHIPAGTSSATSAAELGAALLGNAGQWNMAFPESTQAPTGLLRLIGSPAATRAAQAGVRRQMSPRLEVFADLAYRGNRTRSIYNPASATLTVRASAPTNPFTTDVYVRVPDASQFPITTHSESRSATVGALAQLPRAWTASLDYTWSESRYRSNYYSVDSPARTADLLSGALNPFVDTLRFPLDFQKYLFANPYRGSNRLQEFAVRGAGALPALPWGAPSLTVGVQRRIAQTPERTARAEYPVSVASSYEVKYYARESTTDSGYVEAWVPLVASGRTRGLRALDLQLSGRSERFEVDTGTPYEQTYFNRTPPVTTYESPTLDGQPYFDTARYTSNNYTIGLKYQPVETVTVRVSRATAFMPPTPDQLTLNPEPTTWTTPVDDPATGQTGVPVYTVIGGNPDLMPQSSRSVNAGVIWQPAGRALEGLRLNAEYYRIEQANAIGVLDAQSIVDQEAIYPQRVVRDSAGTITQVDTSYINLYRRVTEGWDLRANYSFGTALGRFSLEATQSIILSLKNQYSRTQPAYDGVEFPSEGGAAKHKSNASMSWERGQWTCSWTARHFGSYKQYGAAGGPGSVQYANGGVYSTRYMVAQGGARIPAQTYHDLFMSYDFDALRSSVPPLKGLVLQLGVRNIFDKVAPLDPYYSSSYYLSPYGGGLGGLRTYMVGLQGSF